MPVFATNLPHALRVGDRIEIAGKISQHARKMSLNLSEDDGDEPRNVVLHFDVRFVHDNIISLSRKSGTWIGSGNYDTNYNMFTPGTYFRIVFEVKRRNLITVYCQDKFHSNFLPKIPIEVAKYIVAWDDIDRITHCFFHMSDAHPTREPDMMKQDDVEVMSCLRSPNKKVGEAKARNAKDESTGDFGDRKFSRTERNHEAKEYRKQCCCTRTRRTGEDKPRLRTSEQSLSENCSTDTNTETQTPDRKHSPTSSRCCDGAQKTSSQICLYTTLLKLLPKSLEETAAAKDCRKKVNEAERDRRGNRGAKYGDTGWRPDARDFLAYHGGPSKKDADEGTRKKAFSDVIGSVLRGLDKKHRQHRS